MGQYFRADDDRMRINNQGCVADPTDWPNGIGCLGGANKPVNGGINYNSTLGYSSGIISDTFHVLFGGALPRFLSGPAAVFTPYAGAIGYLAANPCVLTPGTNTGACPGYVLDNATGTALFGARPGGYGLPLEYYNGTNRPQGRRDINTQLIPRYVADEIQITFSADFDLTEQLTLTTVTGWHQAYVNSQTDYWWSTPDQGFLNQTTNLPETRNFQFTDSNLGGAYGSEFVFDRSRSTDKLFTQELRLVSSFDGLFNFQAGAIYNSGEVRGVYDVWATSLEAFWSIPGDPVGLCPAVNGDPSFTTCMDAAEETSYYRNEVSPTKLQSYAIFGEVYLDITESTRVTVGGRYTDDNKTEQQRVNLWTCVTAANGGEVRPGNLCGRGPLGFRSAGFTEFIWKVSLDQHFDLPWAPESLAYATISTGYKGGGFNPAVDPNQSGGSAGQVPPLFKQETILAYELGYKGTWFDMMQLGLTGFYYDYTDMQIGKIVNRTAVNENVDSAIWGVELETVISPTFLEGLRLDFNLSWLGSEIQNGQSIDGANPTDGATGWMPIKQLLPFPAGQNAVCNPAINTHCIDPIGMPRYGRAPASTRSCREGLRVPARLRPGRPTPGNLADLIAANPNLCGYVNGRLR